MIVYVVRHAAAAERGAGKPDAERPLTQEGIARMKAVARGLCKVGIAPAVIYTSPLVRARQTADILAKALGKDWEATDCEALAPGHTALEVIEFLAKEGGDEAAIVGHEPQLGEVVALMVTGRPKETVDMKKASVACVQFDGRPAAGGGVILWHIVPSIIEKLAGK